MSVATLSGMRHRRIPARAYGASTVSSKHAERGAHAAALATRTARQRALLTGTPVRPQERSRRPAAAMGARYGALAAAAQIEDPMRRGAP